MIVSNPSYSLICTSHELAAASCFESLLFCEKNESWIHVRPEMYAM